MSETTAVMRHLGKDVVYPKYYDKSVLVRESRDTNRKVIGIDSAKLPFYGYDVWNAYENSYLLNCGLPVVNTLKIVYPCNNPWLVESKSLKLYLNSFNMTKMGESYAEAHDEFIRTVQRDLSELLETEVKVCIFSADDRTENPNIIRHLSDFDLIENYAMTGIADRYSVYKKDLDLIKVLDITPTKINYGYKTHLLRSLCKVTSQQDTGDLYIEYTSNKILCPESLLRLVVSFRDTNGFHEECLESIFVALQRKLDPTDVIFVSAFYNRRGSIDINPFRSTVKMDNIEPYATIVDPRCPHCKTVRQ